jgi:hypothetical protein
MATNFWIKLTKECVDFTSIFCISKELCERHLENENISELSVKDTILFLFSLSVVQSDKGHIVVDKSVFLSKEVFDEYAWDANYFIANIKALKSLNMVIYENERELFRFIRDCFKC